MVDSLGNFSDQIDIVVFDRQYSPFIFIFEGRPYPRGKRLCGLRGETTRLTGSIRAEKVASVRPFIGRVSHSLCERYLSRKTIDPILGGILTFESEWSPALGPSFEKALKADLGDGRLDIGCIAAHGHFYYDQAADGFSFVDESKAATAFLFKLIAQLQFSGTVPMIDVEAYGKWLTR